MFSQARHKGQDCIMNLPGTQTFQVLPGTRDEHLTTSACERLDCMLRFRLIKIYLFQGCHECNGLIVFLFLIVFIFSFVRSFSICLSLRDIGFHSKKSEKPTSQIGSLKIIILFSRKQSSRRRASRGNNESLNMILFFYFCTIAVSFIHS